MEMRYMPQKRVKEIGEEGQRRIESSCVLIVGCGALGSPAAMYLAGAGVGSLIIADFDTVDLSNLHRQVFYTEEGVGTSKAESLKARIQSLNSHVRVEVWQKFVGRKYLDENIGKADLIIDAADNPSTTYMLDTWSRENGLPLVTAGVSGWKAQVFVYYPGSLSYSDIFPWPEDEGGILPCSIEGIMGPTAALASSIQTAEALKILAGVGDKKSRLMTADLLTDEFTVALC